MMADYATLIRPTGIRYTILFNLKKLKEQSDIIIRRSMFDVRCSTFDVQFVQC